MLAVPGVLQLGAHLEAARVGRGAGTSAHGPTADLAWRAGRHSRPPRSGSWHHQAERCQSRYVGRRGTVTQPQLYQSYETEKIISFFGSPVEAQSFCNGQWLIFPRTAICLANVGKGPKISFFENGSRLYWVADQPYHVNNSGTYWPGSAGEERAIHLFASPPDSQKFLYLGELEPSHGAVAPGNGNHG